MCGDKKLTILYFNLICFHMIDPPSSRAWRYRPMQEIVGSICALSEIDQGKVLNPEIDREVLGKPR